MKIKKSNHVIILLLLFSSSFAMKRSSEEEIVEFAKKQKIEESYFESLPLDLIKLLSLYLTQATGSDNTAELYNAAHNIRQYMVTNQKSSSLLNNVELNGEIIKILANRYTKGSIIEAGLALATPGATGWLQTQITPDVPIDDLVDALLKAVQKNDERRFDIIIASLPPQDTARYVSISDRFGNTPLHYAASNNYLSIAKKLVENGTQINIANNAGDTPLLYAAQNGFDEILDILLTNDAEHQINRANNDGLTPLYAASKQGHAYAVQRLLGIDGIQVDKSTAGETPLYAASENGYVNIVEQLLNAGAQVNFKHPQNGYTPLFVATSSDHELVVEKLLEARLIDLNEPDNSNVTPLMVASHLGYLPIVKLLLRTGAEVKRMDKLGQNALLYAQQSESPHKYEIIALLEEYGAMQ